MIPGTTRDECTRFVLMMHTDCCCCCSLEYCEYHITLLLPFFVPKNIHSGERTPGRTQGRWDSLARAPVLGACDVTFQNQHGKATTCYYTRYLLHTVAVHLYICCTYPARLRPDTGVRISCVLEPRIRTQNIEGVLQASRLLPGERHRTCLLAFSIDVFRVSSMIPTEDVCGER